MIIWLCFEVQSQTKSPTSYRVGHPRHTENCLGVPREIYNFNTKSLISFQGNVNSKGDLPSVIYFDFETTLPTDNIFDPEQKKCLLYFMF